MKVDLAKKENPVLLSNKGLDSAAPSALAKLSVRDYVKWNSKNIL